jgi:hypothetical protein
MEKTLRRCVEFEILASLTMKSTIFWVVMLCSPQVAGT